MKHPSIELKDKLKVILLPVTIFFTCLEAVRQWYELFVWYGWIFSFLLFAVCITWTIYLFISKIPSDIESSILRPRFSKWNRLGSVTITCFTFLLLIHSLLNTFVFMPPLAEIINLRTKIKDVFHSLSDQKPLPYSFVNDGSDINTFMPFESGVEFYFKIKKNNKYKWLQIVQVDTKVHRFEKLQNVTRPDEEEGLRVIHQPYILVVPIMPSVNNYNVKFVRRRSDDNTKMVMDPIEITEESPQTSVVLIIATKPGIYEITVRLKVIVENREQWFTLCNQKEFAFADQSIEDDAIEKWKSLPDNIKENILKERQQYFLSEQGE